MATFGRRPTKGGAKSVSSSKSGSEGGGGLRKLLEEEAERKRFAQEFEDRRAKEEQAEAEEEARRAEEKRLHASVGENPIVFLDLEVRASRDGEALASGRIEIELWYDSVPKTAENFRCLCTGERGNELHFKGCSFHRIIPGFMAQGGDITRGDGTGGLSIYGKSFEDEKFVKLHSKAGLLSMANAGPNSNNSQFFILFKSAPHLDFKHVVFGELIREEESILKHVERVGSESGTVRGRVVIVDCGQVDEGFEDVD